MTKEALLAKDSWRLALTHYYRLCKEIHEKYSICCELIKKVQQQELDEVFYVNISHECLIVSTHHRYNAKVDNLRIGLRGNFILFEYFSVRKNYTDPIVKEYPLEDGFDAFQQFVPLLLKSGEE